MKNRIGLVIAALTLSLSTAAGAITVPLGVLDAAPDTLTNSFTRIGNVGTVPFNYLDTYTFTLSNTSSIKGVLNVTSIPTSNTGSMSVALSLRGADPAGILGSDNTLGDFLFSDLPAGDYFLDVFGTITGTNGIGRYEGTLATAAAPIDPPVVGVVPEPPAGAMFLLAGFLAFWASARVRGSNRR